MTILTSLILVAAIIAVATAIAYNVQRGAKTLEQLRANYYDNLQDLVPTTPQLENIEVISPQDTDKAVEPIDAVELLSNLLQDEVKKITQEVPAKPKNKRKYYPKAPKAKV